MVFTLPNDLYTTDPNFTTLFRLLDDFNSYSREVQEDERADSKGPRGHGRHRRGPRPRFDIRETREAYELYGEMPGTDRKDVHVELTGQNTLLIWGHVDRGYDAPVAGRAGGGQGKKKGKKGGGGKEEGEEGKKEEDGGKKDDGGKKEDGGGGEGKKEEGGEPIRFLMRERFVGDFEREFAFPGPLQEFDISASLENGILKVTVPKAGTGQGRRIEVQ
ncbi:HSP20-like chaperone [Podospora conica]|nr:HSP20-like chaperone [Schizothecium conicum]